DRQVVGGAPVLIHQRPLLVRQRTCHLCLLTACNRAAHDHQSSRQPRRCGGSSGSMTSTSISSVYLPTLALPLQLARRQSARRPAARLQVSHPAPATPPASGPEVLARKRS